MSGYYLCRTKRTQHPFYIESIGRNIYSLEELCYYLSHYVYLIDETIINKKLCIWIGENLGLVKLQRILQRALEKPGVPAEFIMPIFQECGYLKKQDFIYFQEQFAEIQVEPEDVRRKMKADYLVDFGMYVSALGEYEKILSSKSPGRLGTQFYATVWENMSAAYGRLFQFEEAAECLWESYQTLKSKKVYEKYLRVIALYMSKAQYEKQLEQMKANRDTADRIWDEIQNAIETEGEEENSMEKLSMEETIQTLKEEYIKNTVGR